jgi:hypothetical protein
MRIIVIILLFLACFTVGFVYFDYQNYLDELNQETVNSSDIPSEQFQDPEIELPETTYSDSDLTFVVGEFDLEIFYDPKNSKTLKTLAAEANYDYLINGGFFTQTLTYAGGLIIDGEIENNLAPLDKQLSHMFINAGNYGVVETSNYNLQSNHPLAFQTGPLIINQDIVQDKFINAALNGTGDYIRSFLGYTNSGKLLFGITKKRMSLFELAEKLLKNPDLQSENITIINLDGGTSTALFSKDQSKINYGEFKTLPILLGFRRNL